MRTQAPEDPSPWTETLVADTLPSACIQDEVGIVWLTNPRWRDYSEDCLYVNVFAPNVRQTFSLLADGLTIQFIVFSVTVFYGYVRQSTNVTTASIFTMLLL